MYFICYLLCLVVFNGCLDFRWGCVLNCIVLIVLFQVLLFISNYLVMFCCLFVCYFVFCLCFVLLISVVFCFWVVCVGYWLLGVTFEFGFWYLLLCGFTGGLLGLWGAYVCVFCVWVWGGFVCSRLFGETWFGALILGLV